MPGAPGSNCQFILSVTRLIDGSPRNSCATLTHPFGRDGHEAARVLRGIELRGGLAAGGIGVLMGFPASDSDAQAYIAAFGKDCRGASSRPARPPRRSRG